MNIKFNPTSTLVYDTVPPPQPAKNYIPAWYKNIPAFHTPKPEIDEEGVSNRTLKLCMPFADSLSMGYIQETWQDINITAEKTSDNQVSIKYSYPTKPEIISARSEKSHFVAGSDFYPIEFTFHPVWTPELPEGWSMLYVHPLNRIDLPFHMLSGVVESDKFTHSEEGGNFPFYVKNSFSGVIPKGTPFVQMIPVKREEWESSNQEYDERKQNLQKHKMRQNFWGGYKKEFWEKKTFR